MSQYTLMISDESFEKEVLKSDLPVIVDFWAEWCGPCKMLAPIFEEVAQQFQGKVKFAKVNIDDSQSIAVKYGVRSIPTLILFKDGEPEATKVGLLSKGQLAEFLEGNL